MENKQLNSLVISYQGNTGEEEFPLIYKEVTSRWKKTNTINSLSRKYNLDPDEVESLAMKKLFEIVGSYRETGDFYNMLSVSISRSCRDLRRKENKHEGNVSLDLESNDDGEEATSLANYIPCANAEDEIIEYLQIKDDQRQLIAQLTDKAPSKCVQAAKAFVESGFSYKKAAKLLNTSAPTVKRRIEKIANYFDANQNGYIYDYFTVATA